MRAPRAFADSYSSSTMMPAPSPSTKPSRSLSQGRLALVGSLLRVESAFIELKPATEVGVQPCSAPPAIMMSASPYWIMRIAVPMEWLDEAQAETAVKFGPLNPLRMHNWPEIMLMIVLGT